MKIKLMQDLSYKSTDLFYGRTIEVQLKADGVYYENIHINDYSYSWVDPSREDQKKIQEYYASKEKSQIANNHIANVMNIPMRRTIEVPEGVKKVIFVYEE